MFILKTLLGINTILNDAPTPWAFGFQDGASPSFEGIVELHNQILFYIIIILVGVFWIMFSVIKNFNINTNKIVNKYHNHGTLIELVWTISPALILIAIAFPSFKLLYLMDEVVDPAMTIKVIGFLNGGQKLYKGRFNFNQMKGIYSRPVVNKIKDTIINGQKNSVYNKSQVLI